MCVKHHAEGDYPSSGVVFLDQEQLSSMGEQEHMAPLLSHPLTLPPPPPLSSRCCLENGSSTLKSSKPTLLHSRA